MSRQDWHREYFYSPFPRVTTRQTVGKTPISTMLFPLPPKESLAQICPKFPSLWLSLKKKKEKKKTKPKKDREKKSKLRLKCSRRLNHRGCCAFNGGSPSTAAWEGVWGITLV